jgi:uncharacterized protein
MSESSRTVSMKIQVGGLSEGTHEFRFVAEKGELDLGPSLDSAVTVETTLEKTGSQIFLRASLQAEGTFTCDRCLAGFTRPVSAGYRMFYLFEADDPARRDPAEVQLISPSLNVIDVTEDVRQTLLLSIPLKLLCQDACRGLCPTCGRNRNVEDCNCREDVTDPRWEGLKKLRSEN